MKGRVPQPIDALHARGSKRARLYQRPGTVKAGAPKMPDWLPELARKVWRQTVAAIRAAGLLCPADAAILASYCLASAEVQECTAKLAAEGLMVESHGQTYPHPLLKTRAAAEQRVRSLGSELGLTPLARKRAHVETARPEPPDPLDEFLDYCRPHLSDFKLS
jgi:P27 family predicted phage terminase small subunit